MKRAVIVLASLIGALTLNTFTTPAMAVPLPTANPLTTADTELLVEKAGYRLRRGVFRRFNRLIRRHRWRRRHRRYRHRYYRPRYYGYRRYRHRYHYPRYYGNRHYRRHGDYGRFYQGRRNGGGRHGGNEPSR
ncbi:MAG: hypothetical protein ACR2O4_03410 [Hyphomicrobiaceae bacterium]